MNSFQFIKDWLRERRIRLLRRRLECVAPPLRRVVWRVLRAKILGRSGAGGQ